MAKHELKLEINERFTMLTVEGAPIDIVPKIVLLLGQHPTVKEIFSAAIEVHNNMEAQKNKPSQN